jgi:hypothetical protein
MKSASGEKPQQIELVVVENEPGTVQVKATTDGIEDFERIGGAR